MLAQTHSHIKDFAALAARLHGVKAVGAGLSVRGSEVIRAVR
jgi:hypothetical protein